MSMKSIKTAIFGLALLFASLAVPLTASAAPIDVLKGSCDRSSNSDLCKARGTKLFGPGSIWTNVINTMIFVIGAISVVMIVIGGFRYTVSGGDSGQLNSAKNTILYSIVGLVVALAAYAIVNFVLTRI